MSLKTKIFKTEKLPFVELRYISKVRSCDKQHQHDELTITAIEFGNINIVFDDKEDSLHANEISVVNPNEIHCATLSDIPSLGCYVLYLNQQWCKDIQGDLFDSKSIDFNPFSKSLIEDKFIYSDFISLCKKLLNEEVSSLEKEENIISFISDLFLQFCNINDTIKINTKNTESAYKIKKYLKENVEDDIALKDISTYMELSVVHILRIFKQEFGLPIHSYLLNKKVHLAKDLLSKNITIAEVAQMSGFFDQSHLNRSFKRVFQLTPKQYQANILDERR